MRTSQRYGFSFHTILFNNNKTFKKMYICINYKLIILSWTWRSFRLLFTSTQCSHNEVYTLLPNRPYGFLLLWILSLFLLIFFIIFVFNCFRVGYRSKTWYVFFINSIEGVLASYESTFITLVIEHRRRVRLSVLTKKTTTIFCHSKYKRQGQSYLKKKNNLFG